MRTQRGAYFLAGEGGLMSMWAEPDSSSEAYGRQHDLRHWWRGGTCSCGTGGTLTGSYAWGRVHDRGGLRREALPMWPPAYFKR